MAPDQQFPETYYPFDQPHWTDLIAPVVVLIIAIPLIVWLTCYFRRAMAQYKQCLDQSASAVDVTREAIEITRESVELQRETNRLLAELIEALKNRPIG